MTQNDKPDQNEQPWFLHLQFQFIAIKNERKKKNHINEMCDVI